MMEALDGFHRQALSILTSGEFARAMDLEQEDAATLRRYSLDQSIDRVGTSDGASATLKFLLARRLIEAGVRCVSLSLSDYDTHSGNFARLRYLLPVLDHGLHSFVTDMEERGLLPDVSIVVWGEFGLHRPSTTAPAATTGRRQAWP